MGEVCQQQYVQLAFGIDIRQGAHSPPEGKEAQCGASHRVPQLP